MNFYYLEIVNVKHSTEKAMFFVYTDANIYENFLFVLKYIPLSKSIVPTLISVMISLPYCCGQHKLRNKYKQIMRTFMKCKETLKTYKLPIHIVRCTL